MGTFILDCPKNTLEKYPDEDSNCAVFQGICLPRLIELSFIAINLACFLAENGDEGYLALIFFWFIFAQTFWCCWNCRKCLNKVEAKARHGEYEDDYEYGCCEDC